MIEEQTRCLAKQIRGLVDQQTPSPSRVTITLPELRRLFATPGLSASFFRTVMLHAPGVARRFCQEHLPQRIKRRLSLSDMQLLPDRFVEPHMQDKIGDVVLRVPSRPRAAAGWSYVMVFQCCEPHLLMPVYMQHCEQRLCEMHLRTATDNRPVHFYPLLYYTGSGPYTGPVQLEDLLQHLSAQPMGQA